ncbi:hypothetical protein JLT2_54 [Paraglaciecola Antarctic JLT virus 2]|nr:hypothetical protein JLT2_54 [Paraglaciecola Antarctic JLT virus 2]
MSNYPDDIRDFDNDPRSPFYIDPPVCEECGVELDCDVDCDDEGYYPIYTCSNYDCALNGEDDE